MYASRWTQVGTGNFPPETLMITDEDIEGFMEVVHGLEGSNLDLILHSPGGSAEAAEAIVSYLRSKFKNIRVIVPQAAMSAATLIACAADSIVMGKHSSLGPIDPQLVIQTSLGWQMMPAQAILDQFELAKKECKDHRKLAAWAPMLAQYGPHLLVVCKNVLKMSEELVGRWLEKYMFCNDVKKKAKAAKAAKWLKNHKHFKSHSRHISRDEAEANGLIIEHLEKDQTAQDIFLSIYHSTTITFSGGPATKIIENHLGKAFVKFVQAPQQVPSREK